MTLSEFQAIIRRTYHDKDSARGPLAAYAWLNEEVGELARAMRQGDPERIAEEVSDVLAWLTSLAGLLGVDLDGAAQRFADGCPKCASSPCTCNE
jgi:NTP pyrophosphatase (non-canonical NTP hydrolase)